MKTKYYLIALLISIFNLNLEAASIYTINQNNTISLTTGYVNNMSETWNVVSTVSDKPLIISYSIGTENNYDWLTINNVDNTGIVTSQLLRISGTKNGAISTIVPNGRVQVVFTSDGSVCNSNSPSVYSGINLTFSVNNNYIIDNGLFVTGNSYVSGNVGIGTINPTQKLDVNGNLAVGTNYKIKIMDFPSHTSWIDIPAISGKASGIGSGGVGVNPWIAYAGNASQWFTNSSTGDICYRNSSGKLLFGNTSGSAAMSISGNKIGIGTASPQYLLDVKGIIRATEIKIESVDKFADFVFEQNYTLPQLSEVNRFIKKNKHLPNIPSATEVKENGMSLVEMQVKLLRKIEELTLYAIEQQQRIEELEKKLK